MARGAGSKAAKMVGELVVVGAHHAALPVHASIAAVSALSTAASGGQDNDLPKSHLSSSYCDPVSLNSSDLKPPNAADRAKIAQTLKSSLHRVLEGVLELYETGSLELLLPGPTPIFRALSTVEAERAHKDLSEGTFYHCVVILNGDEIVIAPTGTGHGSRFRGGRIRY